MLLGNGKLDLRSIIDGDSPFGNPFKAPCELAAVLYPTGMLRPNEKQFVAMAGVFGQHDELFWAIEVEAGFENARPHGPFVFDHIGYERYLEAEIITEHILVGPSLRWVAYQSHEEHCLVGCVRELGDLFRIAYPQWLTDWKEFLDCWRANGDGSLPDWVNDIENGLSGALSRTP